MRVMLCEHLATEEDAARASAPDPGFGRRPKPDWPVLALLSFNGLLFYISQREIVPEVAGDVRAGLFLLVGLSVAVFLTLFIIRVCSAVKRRALRRLGWLALVLVGHVLFYFLLQLSISGDFMCSREVALQWDFPRHGKTVYVFNHHCMFDGFATIHVRESALPFLTDLGRYGRILHRGREDAFISMEGDRVVLELSKETVYYDLPTGRRRTAPAR